MRAALITNPRFQVVNDLGDTVLEIRWREGGSFWEGGRIRKLVIADPRSSEIISRLNALTDKAQIDQILVGEINHCRGANP